MPIPKDKKGLTTKQKKFVKEYVKDQLTNPTPPIAKAAMTVYDIDQSDPAKALNTANQIAVENLQKPTIKEAIEKAMEKHNITIDAAVKPIADGLTATRYVGAGETGFEAVDHTTRLKASGMALKLMGAEQKEASGNTFIFNKGDVVGNKYVKD